MRLRDLLDLIQNENETENYLRQIGILKRFDFCIKCPSDKIGMIRNDRYRCYNCKSEWSRRKGSVLSTTRMNYREFLMCIKLFQMELSAEQVSNELAINYKTVRNLFNYIRMKLGNLDEDELNEFSSLMKGNINKVGITLKDDKIQIIFDKGVHEAAVNINRHRIQDSHLYYEFTYGRIKNTGKTETFYITELERFWRFARQRLFSYKGTEYKYFMLYMKEIEFRYNYRNKDLFEEIIGKMAVKLSGQI